MYAAGTSQVPLLLGEWQCTNLHISVIPGHLHSPRAQVPYLTKDILLAVFTQFCTWAPYSTQLQRPFGVKYF